MYELPGYCYLLLIKREMRNKYEWPKYPTITDMLRWEPELQDMDARVGITQVGIRQYHIERGDKYGWDEIFHMAWHGLGGAMIGGTSNPQLSDVSEWRDPQPKGTWADVARK